MSRKSTRSSRSSAKKSKAIDRPFAPAILKRAEELASRYKLMLERNDELGYVGSAVELPNVYADGRTPGACVKATLRALTLAVATMIEDGHNPPLPASAGKRDSQVNVRVSAQEKLVLQEAARRLGYKGVADFVRATALTRGTGAA